MTPSTSYRLAIGLALAAALFLLWGIGALGIIGAGGPPDLMYLAALAVGVVGALVARFRPAGMALALGATALALMVVAVVAIGAGLHHEPGASVIEILGISGMYAAMFAGSAWLFHRASQSPAT